MNLRKVSCLHCLSLVFLIGCATGQEKYGAQVDSLLQKMTLEEKIGQMTLFTSGWDVTGPTLDPDYQAYVKSGKCGNLFNAHTVEYNARLQRMAVEESRLGIPLMFGYDVIHGHKTIFPIPLAESCSWDIEMIEKTAQLSAKEATASGLNWTFNPMVDIARDPRWGRISEGSGEDPYLGSLIAAAKVRGFQGDDLSDPETMLACVKHFAAYGAAQAGRDYHTVDMSERVLRNAYLPPFKAAVDAGAASVMTAFNEYDGVPASASKFLFQQVLRDEWGFKGFVVTDYTAINELVPHGFARDLKHAGELSVNAGIDMDMQGSVFLDHLKALVEEGKVDESTIDRSVKRILIKKFELGLFDDPYLYLDKNREDSIILSEELMAHALQSAKRSIVLLKNEEYHGTELLPIQNSPERIAVIGPLGDSGVDMLGSWHAAGDASKVVTLVKALREAFTGSQIRYVTGCSTESDDRSGFAKAVSVAEEADLIVMAVGENFRQSGEAASRSDIGLPGAQQELVEEIHKTGKPIIAVVMAGRPLTIGWMDEYIPAILCAWQLGTMAGPAITEVLTGKYNPSGKLTVTFPRNVGQVPIYYSMKNTGRPFDADNKYTSKYLDIPNTPLYPFGYGLSYTTFRYTDLQISADTIEFGEILQIEVTVTNTGETAGEETVQLYTRDLVGSVTRPVKELKGFQKIFLNPGQSGTVSFSLTSDDLRFYTHSMKYQAEPGKFFVFVGGNSTDVLEGGFVLQQ